MGKLFIFLLMGHSLYAFILITPQEAMKHHFGENVTIEKKNILLSKKEALQVQAESGTKLKSKIFRIFKATANNVTLGYGVLVSRKVRSKNIVVMNFISQSTLKSIEVIAFNEPQEYLPSSVWNKQFDNTHLTEQHKLSKNIAPITGATLSARGVINGSKIALALYKTVLKD